MSQNFRLGATVLDEGVRFAVRAPRAAGVDLSLIDQQRDIPMSWDDDYHAWMVTVPDIGAHTLYGYRVHGPWEPSRGQRFNPNKLLVDPYARAITGGIDYRGPIHDHTLDFYQLDPTDSAASVPHSVVVADTPPPRPIAHRRALTDHVIYEVHVRGFTKKHPLVPEHLRGTYMGLAYPEVIAYLKDLGITAVQLLPVHHFVSEPFVALKGLVNYWGYNTLGFFAPHASYSKRGSLGCQVTEFKDMVSALHDADIEVFLDVVYNHTAEGGHEGPTLCLRGLDHSGYYRLTNDHREDYDVTGCGNSINTSHELAQELIMDSLRYWVQEMGVDGFRFDLATTLVRDEHHHVDFNHPLKRMIDQDPVLRDVHLIAEPWDIGPYGYQVGNWGQRWSEWNDRFRDHVRDYWRGSVHGVRDLATRLSGSPDIYHREGRGPHSSINYVTAHDGFTMHDLVSYDVKHNQANGESNRDGSDNNRSFNHGWEGPTENPHILATRSRQILNFMATMTLATGVPMLLAGDEMGRTQRGNNNAYCQDSPISWVSWELATSELTERVRALLALRSKHALLRPSQFLHFDEIFDANGAPTGRRQRAWLNESGELMSDADWHDGSRRLLGMYTADENSAWLAWFYSGTQPIEVTLPSAPWGAEFLTVWHSGEATEFAQRYAAGAQLSLQPLTSVVFQVGLSVPA